MKRSGFTRKPPPRIEATQCSYTARPRPIAQASAHAVPALLQPAPKHPRHDSEAWRRAVASLPCMRCGRQGETQAAHRNESKGMGLKTDDALTAALCQWCHAEIDQGAHMEREERRREMDRAILATVRELARRGLIGVTTP